MKRKQKVKGATLTIAVFFDKKLYQLHIIIKRKNTFLFTQGL